MSRVFTGKNTHSAAVADVEARKFLQHVVSVDIDTGEVEMAYSPLRLVGDEIDTYKVRFRSIYPIWAGRAIPVLFHCYGRQA